MKFWVTYIQGSSVQNNCEQAVALPEGELHDKQWS